MPLNCRYLVNAHNTNNVKMNKNALTVQIIVSLDK